MVDEVKVDVDTDSIARAIVNGNTLLAAIIQAIKSVFPQGQTITHTASAGGDTLPANPAGFLTVTLPDGTTGKFPYYDA